MEESKSEDWYNSKYGITAVGQVMTQMCMNALQTLLLTVISDRMQQEGNEYSNYQYECNDNAGTGPVPALLVLLMKIPSATPEVIRYCMMETYSW